MAGSRLEDTRIKLPAVIHLSRLGYAYLPHRNILRDQETNILPAVLRESVSRINERILSEETLRRLMTVLRETLNREDQGESFYRLIRDGWKGMRLIDFHSPRENCFQTAAELLYARGTSRFRPDITLYVNGLPLALIEVKTGNQAKGIRAEYDRMLKRLRNPDARPFLQAIQVLAFSNDRENDPDRLLPTSGAFYAALSDEDFPLYAFQEKNPAGIPAVFSRDRQAEESILADNGMEGRITRGELRRNLSPETPTHRMLTGLFSPERFLFLLRYGILYEREEGKIRKRILSSGQYFALRSLEGKYRRGYRQWTIPAGGAAGETGMMVSLAAWARENIPGARVYWIVQDCRDIPETAQALLACGAVPQSSSRTGGDLILMSLEEAAETWLRQNGEEETAGRRVLLVPAETAETSQGKALQRCLRAADPGLIWISWKRSTVPERKNYTYLLQCADGSLYCGWTNDLEKRVRIHNEGKGAKYTRTRRPVRLVYAEAFATREEAMSREWHLKKMSRTQKLRLIRESLGENRSVKEEEK